MQHGTSLRLHGHPARRHGGFTLIEVMIVVAIVAILASIALPSYRDYIRRGSLPEAFSFLSDSRVKLEQYYQDQRSYGPAGGTACGTTAPSGLKYFTISCALNSATDNQGYTLKATGNAGTPADGHVYTLTSGNAKATVTFKGAASGKGCWLITGSEC